MNVLPIATGLLGTLVGGIIGHRLSIGRDKRIEFNKEAEPLFELLEKQRLTVQSGQFPASANDVSKMTFISIKRKLPRYKRKALDIAVIKYEAAKHNCGESEKGRYKFNKPEVLLAAIEELLIFLPYK